MLPKKQRISRDLFKKVDWPKDGFYSTNHFFLKFFPYFETKASVSVSKKVSKKAVDRNRIRRRIYSKLETQITNLKKGLYHITTKPEARDLKKDKLDTELNKLLNKFLII